MRPRVLVPLACVVALFVVPTAASAKLVVGISENSPSLFLDPTFKKLHAKHVRVVVSYDVMTRKDDEVARVSDYLSRARSAGIEPLVTFEHSRGDASKCNRKKNFKKRVCRLPTAKQYQRDIKLFLKAFPFVRLIAPWNEANHFTQPPSRNPRAAARFTNIVHKACRRCRLVVADMLDQADKPSARHPTFRKTKAYIKEFRRALKVKRTVC